MEMSIKRWSTRKDVAQRDIIHALEQAGCEVFVTERPWDLLVRRHLWRPGWVMGLEVKTPQPNGKPRKRTDQGAQAQVLERCGVPIVTTPMEALRAVGILEHHENGDGV
jgi:hypothetical protein